MLDGEAAQGQREEAFSVLNNPLDNGIWWASESSEQNQISSC
jgi:hypothetical protein